MYVFFKQHFSAGRITRIEMSLVVPDWMTAELFSEILGEEVANLSFSTAAPPGTNYGSVVTRVSVSLRDRAEPMSLIVKSELPNSDFKESLALAETIEHDFYYQFLPEVEKLTDTSFAPKAFPTARATSVILEDLKCLGFKMADRSKQLDFDHCRLYMIAAAKLHAASFAVHKKNPEVLESIGEEKLFSHELKSTAMWKTMLDGGFAHLLKASYGLEEFGRARKVIAAVKEQLWNMVIEVHKKTEGINTINQGDPWITNMMFKYDENGVVQQIKLLDFQCVRFASPVNDIVWFLWSSANHDVKSSRLHDLYNIYLCCFNKSLNEFGCDEVYSEEVFKTDVRKMSPMVLLIMASFYPVFLHTVPIKTSLLLKDSFKFYSHYYGENFCRNDVPKSLQQMDDAGVFDYLEEYIKDL